jgi:hypothetical protein
MDLNNVIENPERKENSIAPPPKNILRRMLAPIR